MIGGTIAFVTPFDVVFSALTGGSAALRVSLLGALVIVGSWATYQSGFRIESHGARYPWLVGVAAALACAVWITILDCWLFRSALDPAYANFINGPLWLRFSYFLPRSFNENIIYRLFVFSCLALALKKLNLANPATIFAAMIVAQCLNIYVNVAVHEQLTAAHILYDSLRYIAPGVLWAFVFAQFGFATAEIAAVGCHVFLQPMFSVFF